VGKPEGITPHERPSYRRNNIKVNFQEIGWEVVDWIDMAYDRDIRQGPVYRIVEFRRHKLRKMFLPAVKRLAFNNDSAPWCYLLSYVFLKSPIFRYWRKNRNRRCVGKIKLQRSE
jgi:hypothetical protein